MTEVLDLLDRLVRRLPFDCKEGDEAKALLKRARAEASERFDVAAFNPATGEVIELDPGVPAHLRGVAQLSLLLKYRGNVYVDSRPAETEED